MAKKRRKMSAAQKAALAKGRARLFGKRPKSKKRRRPIIKKAARRSVRKIHKKKEVPPMAKRKVIRSTGGSKKARRGGRRRRMIGFAGKASGVMGTIKEGAVGIGGGLLAAFVANKLPVADVRIKALAPLAASIILAATLGKRNKMAAQLATGMFVIGGVSAIRNFFPNVPMLAGEEELLYLPNQSLGNPVQIADDDDDQMAGTVSLAEEPEYLSPANI